MVALIDNGSGTGGGGSLDAGDDPWADDGGSSTDSGSDASLDDIEQDQDADTLDLGQADGAGQEYDSSRSSGNVIDSDGDPDTGGVTIVSDNNSDDPAVDDAQQDLTDEALNATSGGGSVPSGTVDSESEEYVDGGSGSPESPGNESSSSDGGIDKRAVAAGLALLVGAVVLGGN
ncbi:hypothetical protein [Halobaculum magnesiiphilum]|uniref:Uncharacterized protein n=1 Tax=Halobaculum magnesiiphilum TaxID=1017351 RepID=A0A8T8WD79_9EURY|nr:hypothetical protein [Halobaculum magnesiiphilum]QZP37746.1 hypothetical protein K6T50_00770 [Halobaculum magnesiiphilum]